MKKEHGVKIEWKAFPLAPHNPLEGIEITEYFRNKGVEVDVAGMMQRLGAEAAREGLPFGRRMRSYNSRRAQELGKWAEAQGKGDGFHMAMFKAYFAHGLNISDFDVLRKAAAELELDPDEAQKVIEEGRYAQAVDADWALCRKIGIPAAPTFVMHGRSVVGAQPYEILEQLVTGSGPGLM